MPKTKTTVTYQGRELEVIRIDDGTDVLLGDCSCGSGEGEGDYSVEGANGYDTGCRECATAGLQYHLDNGTIEVA